MFEKPSAATIQDDHDRHHDRDSKPGWDSHQQQAGLTAAKRWCPGGPAPSTTTLSSY